MMAVDQEEASPPRVCSDVLSIVDPLVASGFITKHPFGKEVSFNNELEYGRSSKGGS